MIPRAIDLFGGGGGMLLAMLMEGWLPAASIDFDVLWTPTFELNFVAEERVFSGFPKVPRLARNLLTTAPKEIEAELAIDLHDLAWVHTSPPCQTHSSCGPRARYGDGHDSLLVPIAWAEACPASYLTIENVVGVESSHRYPEMLGRLRDMKRETLAYTVCSSWYGDPQFRARVWVVSAPPGCPCPPVPPPTVSIPRSWTWAMQNPCPIEDVEDYRYDVPTSWQADILPAVPEGGFSDDVFDPDIRAWIDDMCPHSTNSRFIRRLHRNRPVSTVLTGVKIKGVLRHCHPWLNRPSSVREIARFQSFPDRYVLPHKLKSAYRLLGEAVPLGMGSAFARQIAKSAGLPIVPNSPHSAVFFDGKPDTLFSS